MPLWSTRWDHDSFAAMVQPALDPTDGGRSSATGGGIGSAGARRGRPEAVSELNGHRSGTPIPGDSEPTRPVTFPWQRQPSGAADDSEAAGHEPAVGTAPASGTQPAVANRPGIPTGAQPAVGPASGAQPAVDPGSGTQPDVGPGSGTQPAVARASSTRVQPAMPTGAPSGTQPAMQRPAPARPAARHVPQAPAAAPGRPTGTQPAVPAEEMRPSARGRRKRVEPQANHGPEAAFSVPPPGGRLSHGRGAHLAVRVAIAFTCCLLLLGFTFIIGLLAGRIGSDQTDAVSSGQLGDYHVEQFPLQAAAAVAERYTRLCLNAEPSQANQRAAQLQSIVSSNVPNDCGWDGRGSITATDIEWTGQADPMAQYGSHGRYMHMQASLGDAGTSIQFVVPVYVSNLQTGTGVRIAGEPGILPAGADPSGADAVTEKGGSSDTGLAQMLMADVLPGFFNAWGSSSGADIDRYRTPAATNNVRRGLSDTLTNPEVQAVNVPLPGSGIGQAHTWRTGDAATVETTVTWQIADGAHVTLAYRLTMVRTSATATGWSVRDIAGGLPDSDIDSTTGDNVPTELPSSTVPTDTATSTPSAHSSRPTPSPSNSRRSSAHHHS